MNNRASAGGEKPGRLARALGPFAMADFRRLSLAGFAVFVVRWLEILAVGVFVYQHTGSAFLVALISMLRPLGMMTLGAFIGDLADRMDRRLVLLLVVATLLITSIVLGVLAHADALEVWHLIVAGIINGIVGTFDIPVRRLMLGNAVGPDRLSAAMSIDVASHNASRMLGPLLAGIVLSRVGMDGIYGVSAILHLIALVAVIRVRQRGPVDSAPGPSVSSPLLDVIERLRDGLHLARHDPRLFGTLIVTVIYNIWAWPFISMIPVLGHDNWNLGAEGTGYLASMDGVGAFTGAIVIAFLVRPGLYRVFYVGGAAMFMIMAIVFALVPSAALGGAALLTLGFCGAGFSIMQSTLAFLSAPPDMRGRILGVLSVCIGIGVIGFLHLGLLADLIGARWATVLMCAEGLLAFALTRRYWRVVE
ncbi:MAG: MFS transporter [Alphaproteobacteria bacterium]